MRRAPNHISDVSDVKPTCSQRRRSRAISSRRRRLSLQKTSESRRWSIRSFVVDGVGTCTRKFPSVTTQEAGIPSNNSPEPPLKCRRNCSTSRDTCTLDRTPSTDCCLRITPWSAPQVGTFHPMASASFNTVCLIRSGLLENQATCSRLAGAAVAGWRSGYCLNSIGG